MARGDPPSREELSRMTTAFRTLRKPLPLAAAGVALLAAAMPALARAAPPNDKRADAAELGSLPALVRGTTQGAHFEKTDPAARCSQLSGSVWYHLRTARRRAVVLRVR